MKVPGHLQLEEIKLGAGQEWSGLAEGWTFVLVAGGAAYWLAETSPRPLAEGELLVVPPGFEGTIRASQIGEVALRAFRFSPELLCGLLSLEERRFFESAGEGSFDTVRFLPSTHPAAQQFVTLGGTDGRREGLVRRVELLALIAAVFEGEMAVPPPPSMTGASAQERFRQIIVSMPDTEMVNHSPEELARLCGCSARHFNRLFRAHFGTSTRAWQTEMRMLKARQLLCNTESKVAQVAEQSGYRNLSLFNTLFKKRFGMTPTECRRANKP